MGQTNCCSKGAPVVAQTLAPEANCDYSSAGYRTHTDSDDQQSGEFTIVLQRADIKTGLGVDVDLDDCVSLRVVKLQKDGMVAEWNRRHPDKEVRVNDRFVSVNDTAGNAVQLANECRGSSRLEIQVIRDSTVARSN
mmetsp:Transcript_81108/g.160747  ORF Transcript_81108/g.160747 Transcript_81108/m.160747 type:complete len:137 (-) Transcript_81108:115-525(-)